MSQATRRGFLRGIGGSFLALPWLESIATASTSAAIPLRMAHFYVPIGVVRRGFFPGEADHVIPEGNLGNVMKSLGKQDPNFKVKELAQLTPTMQPLEGFKDKVNLITGMDRTFQNGTDVHAQCASCYLSSAAPYTIERTAWPLDRTLDHLVADLEGPDHLGLGDLLRGGLDHRDGLLGADDDDVEVARLTLRVGGVERCPWAA